MTAVIIVAMETERVHLDDLLPGWEPVESDVWSTQRNGDVFCIACGVGMIAAAAATEHAIATYAPDLVLNFGCTGAHTRDLWPGDVVIGAELVHQGRMRIDADGVINPLPFGFTVPGDTVETDRPQSDPVLVQLAEHVATSMELPAWPHNLRLPEQPDRSPQVHTGTVSSGDVWLQNAALIDAQNERTGSLCEDMEAAAIGQICAMHGVPFLSVKDISNSEFHSFTAFGGEDPGLPVAEVGKRSAMVVVGVLRALAAAGTARRMPTA